MDLFLYFYFEPMLMHLNTEYVVIENPPTVPCDCEIVNIEWADFIDDPEDLETLDRISTSYHFRIHISERRFTADSVVVVIILMAERNYDCYDRRDATALLLQKRFDN